MGRVVVISFTRVAFSIGAALCAGYFIGRWSTTPTQQANMSVVDSGGGGSSATGSNRAFVLLVNMKFTSLANREKFLELVYVVCKNVLSNEGPSTTTINSNSKHGVSSSSSLATTLSYKVAISDKDPITLGPRSEERRV